MFKISYKELRSTNFRTALSKLATCTDLDFKTSYHIARTTKELERAYAKSQKEWVDTAEPILEKDEKGLFKVDDEGFHFKPEVDKTEADKRVGAYLDKEVLVERHKINPEKIHVAKLSPADYAALAPMLEDTP